MRCSARPGRTVPREARQPRNTVGCARRRELTRPDYADPRRSASDPPSGPKTSRCSFPPRQFPPACARPFRGVGAGDSWYAVLPRARAWPEARREGRAGRLPNAALQPRRGGRLGERRRVESGKAAHNVEIDSFSALDVASGRRRCTRPPRRSRLQASQPRQATTRERRPGKWRARWRAAHPASLHADRVTLGQRHRQGMEGVAFGLYARPPLWRAVSHEILPRRTTSCWT